MTMQTITITLSAYQSGGQTKGPYVWTYKEHPYEDETVDQFADRASRGAKNHLDANPPD